MNPFPLDYALFPTGLAAAQDRNRRLVLNADAAVVVRGGCDRVTGDLIDRLRGEGRAAAGGRGRYPPRWCGGGGEGHAASIARWI